MESQKDDGSVTGANSKSKFSRFFGIDSENSLDSVFSLAKLMLKVDGIDLISVKKSIEAILVNFFLLR